MYTYTGPDAVVTGATHAGAISSIIRGTTIAEARWNIRNTRFGTTGNVSFWHNFGYFENTVLVTGNLGGGMILKTGDVLRIETHEYSTASDDGPGPDAAWNDVSWTFQTASIEDLGLFDAVTTVRTLGGAGFGTDTEMAMFDANGVLLRSNDDFEDSLNSGFSGLSLADGTYYLSVTPFDTTFANGLVCPGFWGTGEFSIALNGVTLDTATLGVYSTFWYKFTIGDPVVLCDADFTCDGNTDQDDVACLVNVIAGSPGCECQDADFNRDGNVDQDDVAALINVVAGGSCP